MLKDVHCRAMFHRLERDALFINWLQDLQEEYELHYDHQCSKIIVLQTLWERMPNWTIRPIYWEVQEKEPGVKVSPEDSLANLV